MASFRVDLSGKAALVTGAGAGHGREIALALAEAGASVAAVDINIERADSLCAAIHDKGGESVPLRADISNRFQVANMIERARDAFGGLHILVNAGGIQRAQPLLAIDEWDWRRQLEVNLSGVFFCTQLAARVMADEGGGAIINVVSADSLATLSAGIGGATGAAGVAGLTRQAARELAQYQIRVNAIAAGAESHASAGMALYLCSDAAASVTGQVLSCGQLQSAR